MSERNAPKVVEVVTVDHTVFEVLDTGREIAWRDGRIIGDLVPNAVWPTENGGVRRGTGGWAYRFDDPQPGMPRFVVTRDEGREYLAAKDQI